MDGWWGDNPTEKNDGGPAECVEVPNARAVGLAA